MEELDLLGTGEKAISLGDAAKLLPLKEGKHISVKIITRWIRFGYGPKKGRVFLEATKVGSTFFTSAGALKRFTDKCLAADRGKFFIPQAAVNAVEAKAGNKPRPKTKAERALEAAGYGSGSKRTPAKAS